MMFSDFLRLLGAFILGGTFGVITMALIAGGADDDFTNN